MKRTTMEKIGTPECQLFIAAHYAQNDIDTQADDWILEKKYKNFHGFTCRDFHNPFLDIRAVIVANCVNGNYQLEVLENATYQIFLNAMAQKPLFYYVPVVTNDGLVFYFEKTMNFDAVNEVEVNRTKHLPYLLKKLSTLFSDEQMCVMRDGTIAFSHSEIEDIIYILENNTLAYNEKIYPLLNTAKYQPFMINAYLEKFNFPGDTKLNNEEIIEAIFSLVSQQRDLNKEELARIKKLLHKLPEEEISSIEKIMISFRPKQDDQLEKIINDELAIHYNKEVWKAVYNNKG